MDKSKRYKQLIEKVNIEKDYELDEAIAVLKDITSAKFNETVEIAVSLGIDPKHADQLVRGTTVLPHGTGKTIKVLVICKGEAEKKAKEAGADYAGGSELVEKIKTGWLDFDTVISTPDMMREVGQLGKILGPRGLMPSPKAGTVTLDIEKAIKEVKAGKIEFKNDKLGNIQMGLAKISFDANAIKENILKVLSSIFKAKPVSVKGKYIKSVYISTTMSPGLKLNIAYLEKIM